MRIGEFIGVWTRGENTPADKYPNPPIFAVPCTPDTVGAWRNLGGHWVCERNVFTLGQLVKMEVKMEWGGEYCYGRVYYLDDKGIAVEFPNGRCVGGPLDKLTREGIELSPCNGAEPGYARMKEWAQEYPK